MRWWLNGRMGVYALCALSLAGCADHPHGNITYNTAGFVAPDTQFPVVQSNYYLGPQDLISVSVYDAPEVSGDFQISPSGTIDIPLVGSVLAQGKTAGELGQDLQAKLGAKYFQNPKVTVAVKQAVSQRLTVDGSVNAPGVYPISGQQTLVQAIALAKGVSEYGSTRRVVVFRTINGQRQAAAFDLAAIRDGRQPDPPLYGNDVVVVDGSRTKKTWGDILKSVPLLGFFRPF